MRNLLLITAIFLCSLVFGQEESKTSIAGGAKALLFEFNGLSTISAGSYEGGIGGKMFFNNKLGLRAILNFDHFSDKIPANPLAGQQSVNGENSGTTFGLGAALEYHLRSRARVSPYIGGGLIYSRTSSEQKQDVAYNPFPANDVSQRISKQSGAYSFDMTGIVGAELFILREVSLSAEYMLGLSFYNDGDTKTTYVFVNGDPNAVPAGTTSKGDSGWSFGTGSRGRLILSIYF